MHSDADSWIDVVLESVFGGHRGRREGLLFVCPLAHFLPVFDDTRLEEWHVLLVTTWNDFNMQRNMASSLPWSAIIELDVLLLF